MITKTMLEDLYVVQGKTDEEIARLYGFKTRGSIWKLRKRWNIVSKKRWERLVCNPSAEQMQVIVGTLLGDGCLSSKKESCLRIVHGEKQKEYVYWKYGLLEDIACAPPRQNRRGRWWFETHRHPFFTGLYRQFYQHGVKIVPVTMLESLTELGLAVWFMDDGGRHGKQALKICTCSFSSSENTILSQWFSSQGIPCHVRKMGGYEYLVFNKIDGGCSCLKTKIEHLIHPSLKYKLIPCHTQNANGHYRCVSRHPLHAYIGTNRPNCRT